MRLFKGFNMFKNILSSEGKRSTSKVFEAPTKGNYTTGRGVQAGDDFGVGHTNPVGSFGFSKTEALPSGCKKTDPDNLYIT